MTRLTFLISVALLAGACRERVDDPDRNDFRKPVETVTVEKTTVVDDDFVTTRTTYETHSRERLSRIDAKIRELEARGEAAASKAAAELRVRRDQLSSRLQTVGQQAKAGWDQFEADMSRSFDELERDLDAAF